MSYIVVESETLSSRWEPRYVVVDEKTGEILDDAQGYGFKSKKKAHACYRYRTRDRSKDKEKEEKKRVIRQWMKDNKGFVRCMDQYAFEIAKGSWGPEDKFNAAFVKKMLKDSNYTDLPFTPGELLRVWRE